MRADDGSPQSPDNKSLGGVYTGFLRRRLADDGPRGRDALLRDAHDLQADG
jgi:hypothetical protein